jgi:hypothetical protein
MVVFLVPENYISDGPLSDEEAARAVGSGPARARMVSPPANVDRIANGGSSSTGDTAKPGNDSRDARGGRVFAWPGEKTRLAGAICVHIDSSFRSQGPAAGNLKIVFSTSLDGRSGQPLKEDAVNRPERTHR